MSLKNKMFNGVVWSAIDAISIQGIQFFFGIILARILTPEEYGILGILIVFISVSNVFIDSGFTSALIQNQKRTDKDISTAFFFNVFISLVCYAILWISAPFIADFYSIDLLTNLLRILALSLIINALFTVPITLITIKLDFKSLTKVNLIATIISGIIAIYMAYNGYGVWALVAQTIIKSSITALLIWFFVEWKPIYKFSKASFKRMFSYGSNILFGSLLGSAVDNFTSIFIAKTLSTSDLGYYTRGTQFPNTVLNVLNTILGRVLFPGLSTVQNQRSLLINHTRVILKATAIITVPIFILLAIIAEPLILVLLTDKWIQAVPIMQIFCVARLITIISGISLNILYVIGRTDLTLKQQYFKIIVRVPFVIVALKYGLIYIALAELLSTIVHFFINTYYPGKIMSYGAFSQLKDIFPIIISGLIMAFVVYFNISYVDNNFTKLLIAPIIALPIYGFLMYLFKVNDFFILISKTKKIFKK